MLTNKISDMKREIIIGEHKNAKRKWKRKRLKKSTRKGKRQAFDESKNRSIVSVSTLQELGSQMMESLS